MKKLMIAAAVASVGAVAFGGLCDTVSPQAEGTCRAYDFKASVKLVDGMKADDVIEKLEGTRVFNTSNS